MRPSGIRLVAAAVKVAFSKNASVIGVRVNPGATALTRTPCSAQSIASERVSAATAPFAAVYAACWGNETSAACEATLTTAPRAASEERPEGLGRLEDAEEVDLEVAAEVLGVELVDGCVGGEDARSVDEDVQAAVAVGDLGRELVERGPIGDVAGRLAGQIDDVDPCAASPSSSATAPPIPDAPPVTTAIQPCMPAITAALYGVRGRRRARRPQCPQGGFPQGV